jgi:hypothetical protein
MWYGHYRVIFSSLKLGLVVQIG